MSCRRGQKIIIDPVGLFPTFVALAHRQEKERRHRTAAQSIAFVRQGDIRSITEA